MRGPHPLLFAVPAFLALATFVYLPTALAFVASLYDLTLTADNWEFVGFGNYREALGDADVRQAAWNTVVYTVLTVVPSVALGLGLALLVDGVRRGRALVQALLFLPITANLVAMGIVFSWIFSTRGGFVNTVLGYVGVGPIDFLGSTTWALPSVAALGVWRGTAFAMVIYLAGLTTIPSVIHDAAAADGLRGWAKFRTVIWPLLRPTTVFVVVVTFIGAVQVFEAIATMTDGGPLGASETMLYLVWRTGFTVFRLGYASALAFVMLLAVVMVGLARARWLSSGSAG